MVVCYIASAYSLPLGQQEANARKSMAVANQLIDLGYCPICPLLSHFLNEMQGRPENQWYRIGLQMVTRSDVVLRLAGESRGADMECILAETLKIPVVFSIEELQQLTSAIEEAQEDSDE